MVMKQRFIFIKSDVKHCSAMPDIDLVRHYKKFQNKEVLGEFFNRYMHLVYAVCMRYLRDNEQARDAAMEIFESLTEKLLQFDVKNFKGWIFKVSRNYCLMELRKRKREIDIDNVKVFSDLDVENSLILHPDKEEDIAEHEITGFLEQLTNCQRRCLEMMYFQNMSYKEIASETGYTLKQVKSYIQNGKRKLKLLVKERK